FIVLIEANDAYMLFSQFLGSVIIGLGIYFSLLVVNISSNLTSNVIKIIPTFIFVGIIIFVNHSLFIPKSNEKLLSDVGGKNARDPNKKSISLFHFIILGVLFVFSTMWIFNPMALSAYDLHQNCQYILDQSLEIYKYQ
ncbi:unnamed protein product, partial [marine sediment metagenome]